MSKIVSLKEVAAKLAAHCDLETLRGNSSIDFEVAYALSCPSQAEYICRFVLDAAGVKYVENVDV